MTVAHQKVNLELVCNALLFASKGLDSVFDSCQIFFNSSPKNLCQKSSTDLDHRLAAVSLLDKEFETIFAHFNNL